MKKMIKRWLSGISYLQFNKGKTRDHRDVIHSHAELEDVRAVGPLAEALWLGNREVREIAEVALIRLLPRLQVSDAHLLSDRQRQCLCRALGSKHPELTLAILKAFERIGDSTALPYVERVVVGRGVSAKDHRIREAAMECLPYLKERVDRVRQENQLLRCSTAPSVPSEALRPAPSDNRKGD